MKGPIIPVTAQHRQPAAIASKDRCVDSCSLWAPVGTACPAGHNGWDSVQTLPLRRIHGLFPQSILVQVWYPPLLVLGVELVNMLSLSHFSALPAFLPFSSPKRLGGCSSYLTLKVGGTC